MLSSEDIGKLNEIQRLLDEAYANYFEKDPEGYCKSSEGAVTVSFGTFFDRRAGYLDIKFVDIYSYVFGPDRLNTYKTTDEALAAVTEWHKQEMARDYAKEDEN